MRTVVWSKEGEVMNFYVIIMAGSKNLINCLMIIKWDYDKELADEGHSWPPLNFYLVFSIH